jgi:hypothetical protein
MKRFLELTIIFAAIFMLARVAMAVPMNNKLISPDSVTVSGKKVLVKYTLPCEYNESVAYPIVTDDSGDREIGVGVVYSMTTRNKCTESKKKQFSETLDFRRQGFNVETDYFVPMSVAK